MSLPNSGEKRRGARCRVETMVNKYIGGYPYACRLVNLSNGGMLVEKVSEPLHSSKAYPVEIGLPGTDDRVWAWAKQVGCSGKRQALKFMAIDPFDEILLNQYLRRKLR